MKSKHRVQKHGEVFTPQWVVDKMIAIPGIKEKTEDLFATFLEPSAGEGAFLLAIEDIKLRFVTENHSGDSHKRACKGQKIRRARRLAGARGYEGILFGDVPEEEASE